MAFSYDIPEIPFLLTVASFIFILNVAEELAKILLKAGLLGSIVVGIVYGPEAANIIPLSGQETFLVLGYIGLLLIVFEAGLTTDMTLLHRNIYLSMTAALTGIVLPIGLSMLLLTVGYKYSALQGFTAGAALCSTSLGTTLSLLGPELKQTRTGVIILSAALFDDIVGLVIASVIGEISSNSGRVGWASIVRPILVSAAFIMVTYIAARLLVLIPGLPRLQGRRTQLFLVVFTLAGYVAGAKYAGTSELLGAYLAETLLAHVFTCEEASTTHVQDIDATKSEIQIQYTPQPRIVTPISVFTSQMEPLLATLLSPLFFASIGAALPMSSLGSVEGSHRVVWRGIIYSLLMFVAKAAVGLTILVWPDPNRSRGWFGRRRVRLDDGADDDTVSLKLLTSWQSVLLLGVAMVARGEIALIVAQLGQPLLEGSNAEAFAVVNWAILLNTAGGALGVGLLLCKQM
ncbi:hypothetical protein BDZ89DRAFT_949728 [Hymenopellis radicata]|nr:hypothetical protein BDZ89DRAFT_949728 [Hymenopellis radicata]